MYCVRHDRLFHGGLTHSAQKRFLGYCVRHDRLFHGGLTPSHGNLLDCSGAFGTTASFTAD